MRKIKLTQFILFLILTQIKCSEENNSSRNIRAHNLDIQGVHHAIGHFKANRYCIECHGDNLQGGLELIPSCYTCHGENWNKTDSQISFAPLDHTVSYKIYNHHPELSNPMSTCIECHGLNLEGDNLNNRPSCFLCHTQKW